MRALPCSEPTHCATESKQCAFLFTSVQYVRETAPDRFAAPARTLTRVQEELGTLQDAVQTGRLASAIEALDTGTPRRLRPLKPSRLRTLIGLADPAAFMARLDGIYQRIIDKLNLLRPIYRSTTNYGHFGKPGLPWEA